MLLAHCRLCGIPFLTRRKAMWCSKAHKEEAYRIRRVLSDEPTHYRSLAEYLSAPRRDLRRWLGHVHGEDA
jgi:hypothetical protein